MKPFTTTLWNVVRPRISVDARALGIFRISLGVVLLLDILFRFQNVYAHYTDMGVLPRSVAIANYLPAEAISIHFMTGTTWGVSLLFLVQLGLAVLLIVGYRTRIVTAAAWFMWMSLHNRMPLVLNGGDDLIRMTLFWAMFVPLGARYSVDAVQRGGYRDSVATLGTLGLLLNVVIMYSVNGLLKQSGTIWPQGEGLAYVMRLDQFTTVFGDLLSNFSGVMTVLSLAVLALWLLSPGLLLFTGRLRTGLATAMAAVQAGIGLTMHVGLFPLIAITTLIPFYPAQVFDRVLPRLQEMAGDRRVPTDWIAALPGPRGDTDVPARVKQVARYAVFGVALFGLCYMLLWNVQTTSYEVGEGRDVLPLPVQNVGEAVRLETHWTMFAPSPMRYDGWYVVAGLLEDGTRIDVMRGEGPVSYRKPGDVWSTYGSARWRKYLVNLYDDDNSEYRQYYAEYLCRRWNENHDRALMNLTMTYVVERTYSGGEMAPEQEQVATHRCFGEP
ncbi:MAG: HTTM domain-containing protein [Candidatus Nanohaloarchaea archaeon]|nr:HTTM domain-containing protein [Candidatus Nanohaloarchaea archaeon]